MGTGFASGLELQKKSSTSLLVARRDYFVVMSLVSVGGLKSKRKNYENFN